ncbi:MAG: potassium/proton antiporter [Bacteroidales bacterium]|jgi:cell volume regulation protein A|nr:potassium/proton antiporter [Bacteroidales bacterium]
MNITFENILLIGSFLLGISILVGKTSFRLGVPTLILFVIVGMLAGSEGFGGINFDSPSIARFVGIVALNVILFSGGLETRWESIKPVIWHGLTLSTVGVFLTAISVGIFVWAITDFTFLEGLLLGSIVSSTDAAAVFSILRARNLGLKKNIRATLELESGSNDPMAYFLTVAVMGLILSGEQSAASIIPLFIKQVIIGTVLGLLIGRLGKEIINRIALDYEGLYPVLVIALMFFTFSATDFLGGNGFLAIYLCAIYLGNQYLIHKKTILQVFDGMAWLMQIVLFLTLGLLVFPSHIIPVLGLGLLVSAFLMFVARPFAVFACLLPFRVKLKTITFISWVGLRGAVPIVFATYPLLAGIDKSQMIFNVVFFISLTSVLLQGTTLRFFANRLRVSVPERAKQRTPPDIELSDTMKSELTEIEIDDTSNAAGKRILDIGFPRAALIALIKRNGTFITPNGSTVIQPGDTLVIIAENSESLEKVRECLYPARLAEST